MISTKLKKDDVVTVNSGDDKGKRGKILFVDKTKGRVVVEGINKKVKHVKANKNNQSGGRIVMEFPFKISNVSYFCDKCKKGVRLGIEIKNSDKQRICKKCGEVL